MYEHIIFDLDGTLTNPKQGIINSVKYAFDKMGLKLNDLESLTSFIGPPLQESFRQHYNFSDDEMDIVIKHFRTYFAEKGIFENEIYPGILELLEILNVQNKKLYIATSKLQRFAVQVLDHFKMSSYFKDVQGADYAGEHAEKSTLIELLMHKNRILDTHSVIMVGDRKYDIKGANMLHIDSIAVLYGYGTKKELTKCNPTYTVASVKRLAVVLSSPGQ